MNPLNFPLAILGVVSLVAIIPVWTWFLGEYTSGLPTEVQFLAGITLPALVVLFGVSWVEPG